MLQESMYCNEKGRRSDNYIVIGCKEGCHHGDISPGHRWNGCDDDNFCFSEGFDHIDSQRSWSLRQAAYINTFVAGGMAPNRRHAISNQRDDQTMTSMCEITPYSIHIIIVSRDAMQSTSLMTRM